MTRSEIFHGKKRRSNNLRAIRTTTTHPLPPDYNCAFVRRYFPQSAVACFAEIREKPEAFESFPLSLFSPTPAALSSLRKLLHSQSGSGPVTKVYACSCIYSAILPVFRNIFERTYARCAFPVQISALKFNRCGNRRRCCCYVVVVVAVAAAAATRGGSGKKPLVSISLSFPIRWSMIRANRA